MRRATLNKKIRSFILVSLGGCAFGSSEQLALSTCTGPLLNQIKHGGNKENADEARSQHASDDSCPHDLAGHGARARSGPQRDSTQNESKRSHQDRAKPQASSLERRVRQGLALFVL